MVIHRFEAFSGSIFAATQNILIRGTKWRSDSNSAYMVPTMDFLNFEQPAVLLGPVRIRNYDRHGPIPPEKLSKQLFNRTDIVFPRD